MNIVNSTNMSAAYAPGRLKSGHSCIVVVSKATYAIPEDPRQAAKLLTPQPKPFDSDQNMGDPELYPPKFEHDFSPVKHRCDVVLQGTAHAPKGIATEKVEVGLAIGKWNKRFEVVGDRHWINGAMGWTHSDPIPFTTMPLTWMNAYGGTDQYAEDRCDSYLSNPVGRSYCHIADNRLVGQLLPNTQQLGHPIATPNDTYLPQSFGPIARHWLPRRKYVGTYDEKWQQERAPYLPDDFDERYYQCAPEDQQISSPVGGEKVVLYNLTEHVISEFYLPKSLVVSMTSVDVNGERHDLKPMMDTIAIDTDARTFSLTWRAHMLTPHGGKEIDTILVGTPTPAWERSRLTGKEYRPMESLDDLNVVVDSDVD